jgi:peptidoglycan/xylan/chitin deacetylase (PgdA/CDA1 family)
VVTIFRKFLHNIKKKRKVVRPKHRSVLFGAVLLAVIIEVYGASLAYVGWVALRSEQWSRNAALPAAYHIKRPPRYELLRKRNGVLVTERHPDIPPVQPAGDIIPIISHLQTDNPVIFITIDDGVFQDQAAAEFMTSLRLPFTLFLTTDAIKHNYPFFERLQAVEMGIENHTLTHSRLKRLPIETQRTEICGNSDDMAAHYGRRPVLFRPPYGEYNEQTLQAAKDCGITNIVLWNVVVDHGKLEYQLPHTQLEPGDIVLLHFRPELMQDIQTVLGQAHAQNLSIANLEDWL